MMDMEIALPNELKSKFSCLHESVNLAADNDSFYRRRFQEESGRLFGHNVDDLESLVIPCNASGMYGDVHQPSNSNDPKWQLLELAFPKTMSGVDEVLRVRDGETN